MQKMQSQIIIYSIGQMSGLSKSPPPQTPKVWC